MMEAGKLIDVTLNALIDQLVARPGLSFLRLHGDGVDVRIIHVGREQCFVVDHARKIRDRLGERLVRWGHLKRDVLLRLLAEAEERKSILDFTSQVSLSTVEYVATTQALDSLDRLVLFPHLDFEFGEQLTGYRGAKLTANALKKRLAWASSVKHVFLKWRSRMGSGDLQFYPAAREKSPVHTAVECAILEKSGWDGIQCRLHDPLFKLAEHLEALESDGSIMFVEHAQAELPTILRSRWRWVQNVGGLILLLGIVFFGKIDFTSLQVRMVESIDFVKGELLAQHALVRVTFEAESYQERYGKYPSREILANRLQKPQDDKASPVVIMPYRYIDFVDDFLLERDKREDRQP